MPSVEGVIKTSWKFRKFSDLTQIGHDASRMSDSYIYQMYQMREVDCPASLMPELVYIQPEASRTNKVCQS